uniref:Uncharacterized protein n=1 Tax=Arundo donax TaxID=35708 RepID=A0A0A8Y763_ARUDO
MNPALIDWFSDNPMTGLSDNPLIACS